MKKRSRREKNILKMMAFVLAIALFGEVYDWHLANKEDLQSDIDRARREITTYLKELEGENLEQYATETVLLEERLVQARDKVLRLRNETEANLKIRETLSVKAEEAGVVINSINNRKSKPIQEDMPLQTLRTYFGYDTELSALLQFFDSISDQEYYLAIENLNITARRRPRPRKGRGKRPRIKQRKPLNGNMILTSLFLPSEGSESGPKSTSLASKLDGEPEESGILNPDDPEDRKRAETPFKYVLPPEVGANKDLEPEPKPATKSRSLTKATKPGQPGLQKAKDTESKPLSLQKDKPKPKRKREQEPTSKSVPLKPFPFKQGDENPTQNPSPIQLNPKPDLKGKPAPLSGPARPSKNSN